jgi:hypothetical protein
MLLGNKAHQAANSRPFSNSLGQTLAERQAPDDRANTRNVSQPDADINVAKSSKEFP